MRFFARIREVVGESQLELPLSAETATLDALQASLGTRGEAWRGALTEANLVRAVNHQVVHGNTPLAEGDEVAFYPPVTGG
ncbi:MoaD/ThiS family protein [Parahaliea mediterranea]|uniref:MoaD/ThiS family protein n=1 Tax=Parahaliea mediterranea TaxID=651086 RepID=UPI00321A73C0